MEPYAGTVLHDAYAWVRRHPRAADGLLAALLLAASAGQLRISPLSVALAATAVSTLIAGPVFGPRRAPLAAFAGVVLLGAARLALGVQPGGDDPPVHALE